MQANRDLDAVLNNLTRLTPQKKMDMRYVKTHSTFDLVVWVHMVIGAMQIP